MVSLTDEQVETVEQAARACFAEESDIEGIKTEAGSFRTKRSQRSGQTEPSTTPMASAQSAGVTIQKCSVDGASAFCRCIIVASYLRRTALRSRRSVTSR